MIDIEAAKSGAYVLAQVKNDAPQWQGRWFVVRYIAANDWALFPGYSVGDDWFSQFAQMPVEGATL